MLAHQQQTLLCVLRVFVSSAFVTQKQNRASTQIADARSLICANSAADTALLAVFDLFKLGIDDIIIGLARLAT
jgi:hypothetical protein